MAFIVFLLQLHQAKPVRQIVKKSLLWSTLYSDRAALYKTGRCVTAYMIPSLLGSLVFHYFKRQHRQDGL